ncbi:hypothetical protein BCCGELA001_11740 [Bradyrhizobium sp. CCGE-LA001]|nr:hypothetical protein BCCGELA001_11740 [Bradyrhizobium sp. CCGE-LA001]
MIDEELVVDDGAAATIAVLKGSPGVVTGHELGGLEAPAADHKERLHSAAVASPIQAACLRMRVMGEPAPVTGRHVLQHCCVLMAAATQALTRCDPLTAGRDELPDADTHSSLRTTRRTLGGVLLAHRVSSNDRANV